MNGCNTLQTINTTNLTSKMLIYHRCTMWCSASAEVLSTAAQHWKILCNKACNRWLTLKVTQGHPKWCYVMGHISLPISGLIGPCTVCICIAKLKCLASPIVKLPSVLWRCWLGGTKCIRPVKIWGDGGGGHCLLRMEWRPAGWSVCLPLLIFPCTIKSRSSLLAPAHLGGPGKRAVKWLWW